MTYWNLARGRSSLTRNFAGLVSWYGVGKAGSGIGNLALNFLMAQVQYKAAAYLAACFWRIWPALFGFGPTRVDGWIVVSRYSR